MQKKWTIDTILVITRVANRLGYEYFLKRSGGNQILFMQQPDHEGTPNDIDNVKTQLVESFAMIGLTMKRSESWHSSRLFCYQRKYYFDGVQCGHGTKMTTRGYSSSSEMSMGLTSLITTAMSCGDSIGEASHDPVVGLYFSYMEAYGSLLLTPGLKELVPDNPRVLAALSWVKTRILDSFISLS